MLLSRSEKWHLPLNRFPFRQARAGVLVIFILFIKAYRLIISPFLHVLAGPSAGCRFEPTCSRYAIEALQVYGIRHGSVMILRRFCKCQPWGDGGYDPVPPLSSKTHGS